MPRSPRPLAPPRSRPPRRFGARSYGSFAFAGVLLLPLAGGALQDPEPTTSEADEAAQPLADETSGTDAVPSAALGDEPSAQRVAATVTLVDPACGAAVAEILCELRRLGAGAPPTPPAPLVLKLVDPSVRELYLRARELERKADRLARERRFAGAEPEPLAAEPNEVDLLRSLERVLARLHALRSTAPPDAQPCEPGRDREDPARPIASTELMLGVLSAGAGFEELCERPPLAGDVFFAATRALACSTALRSRAPGRRMPLATPLEPVCTNDDVQRALADCWERVEGLVARTGAPRLTLAPAADALQVKTAELLEQASILADELGLLHARYGDGSPLPPTCHPGSRRTAELLQRVSILERQLDDLDASGAPLVRSSRSGDSAP